LAFLSFASSFAPKLGGITIQNTTNTIIITDHPQFPNLPLLHLSPLILQMGVAITLVEFLMYEILGL
jgi:hypothetical protein